MRRLAQSPPSAHKLACPRRIIEGSGVEAYPRLSGAAAEAFEQVLQQPKNEGIRQTMKTWTEQQQEIGRKLKAQEDVLRVREARFSPLPPTAVARIRQLDDEAALDALPARVATAATLAETGLV